MFGRKRHSAGPVNTAMPPPRETLSRMLVLKIALLVLFAVIALRLVQIQVLDAGKYQEIARRQYEAKLVLPAARGNLFDRHGKLLVSNSMTVSFGADPKMLRGKADAIATRFARVFESSKREYLEKLSQDDRHFVWLERRVRPAYSRQLRVREFQGTVEVEEPRRLYHYDCIGGQLIGFTDVDNNGLSGVELQLNGMLKGLNGQMIMQRDGLGRKRPSVDYPRVEPINGKHAVLTLDIEYQAIAEEELRKGVERTKAESGLAVILDPATGEILAMAQCPLVNPNEPSRYSQSALKNRAITDMFEPGSVFKLITAGAALEHHLMKPERKFFAENGTYLVPLRNGKTRKINDMHRYGTLTLQEAMEQSSNIVMAKVSDVVGAELLYTTARDFGFGTRTGVDLPGEVDGQLKKPSEWSGTTLNTMAYGYEVNVTPLQIACAYAAVANKGILMKPFVIRQVMDEQGEVLQETHPQVVRRAIDQSTAETLTRFFEGVVERGTGTAAKIPGLRVAGKTGTSRRVIDRRYDPSNHTASFVGYFPADNPKVVCLVMLDSPHEGGYTGGMASAPIFHGIAQKIYATSGRFASQPAPAIAGKAMIVVPDVTSLKVEAARTMLSSHGFAAVLQGNGEQVLKQVPAAGARHVQGSAITLVTGGSKEQALPAGYALVPDVRGLSIRRAVNRLSTAQLDAGINGSGIVSSQSPGAGEQVKIGSRIELRCQPPASKYLSVMGMKASPASTIQ
jgi:cell division protein FtsI (penicillin-binding protein 3)